MKKSLIALAVAGTFAAPAFAATSNVDIYGTVRASVDFIDSKAANSDRWTISDRVSRVGIKGSEDLGGGLKAVYQWESQLNQTSNNAVAPTVGNTVGTTQRNTFVGLAGGFGTVLVGTHDTPYKLGGSADVFADTAADSQAGANGIIGRNGFDNRVNGTIAYVSPDFSGFHFAAAIVPGEGVGVGAAKGLMDAYSLVGVYANGPLKATLAYENFDNKMAAAASDANATKFNIAYKIGDIGLGYTFERSDDSFAAAQSTDSAHLASVTYGMGPITLAGQYGKFNKKAAYTGAAGGILAATAAGNDDDLSRWTVGAMYNLSKRTNVYAAYNSDNFKDDTVNNDATTWTFGLNHSF